MNRLFVLCCLLLSSGLTLVVSAQNADAPKPSAVNQTEARKAPDWVNSGIMYQINLRAFTKEGTLKAAEAKLPDLAKLGITIVYFCPMFTADDDMRQEFWSPRQKKSGMNSPRNPYRMKDYFSVDPEYGTADDLVKFVQTAKTLNIKVLLDLVYLHCGPAAVFIKDHPDFVKRDKDGNAVNAAWAFPALNFDNPELREYLYGNMEFLLKKFDVDGFRCDVGDGIPLDFWVEGRKRIDKIKPNLAMLNEGSKPDAQNFAFDMNYGFPIYPAIKNVMDGKNPVSHLAEAKKTQLNRQPKGGRFIHYIDNHDITNDDYEKRREHHWGKDGVEAALVACFTFDGIPLLYNGQEIADKQRHSIFGNLAIDWSKANTEEAKSRFEFCQKLIQLRKKHPALQAAGSITFTKNSKPDMVLSFERKLDNEKILVVINLRNEPVAVDVESEITPTAVLFEKGKQIKHLSFELPSYGWYIGK
ncbi:MAG: alpha-amylase family glycosyl hydrolase [Planctomycetaceae bacterium]|nr:alpha-amylase family glycosyl hydrolase [Planctomycetaceae bacterium]